MNNLVAWWKLDKLNGSGDVPDASGNGRDFTDGAATFASGKIGNAAYFDGTGYERLYRSILPELSLYLPWSIAFWFMVDSATSETVTLLNQRDSVNNRIAIQYNSAVDQVRVLLYDNYLSAGVIGRLSGAFSRNVWGHFALTWNGSDEGKLYLDGVLQTGTSNAGSSSTQVFVIGARYGGTAPLYGAMDDLRIYDGVLNLKKVKAIIADHKGRPYPWQPEIVEPTVEEVIQHG